MNPHRARKPDEFDESPIKYPSKLPPSTDGKNPNVIIVGAGIGGLFLAILLDKAGIPYEIYERSSCVRPLGSVMSLTANVLAAFEQIDMLDELKAISFSHKKTNLMYDNMKIMTTFDNPNMDDVIGYDILLFSRPKLYQLLLSKVPLEKIHYSKKVMSTMQNKEGVMIRCADGTTYHGDVLVGADGAYSGVRQSLFKNMQQQNLLPASDAKELSKGYLCMVGTTDPMDPEKFPYVKNEGCTFSQIIGRGTSYNWAEFNMPENRVCWVVVSQIATVAESEQIKFRNSEWGPESNPEFIGLVKDFKVPGCGTLGNLINATPTANISRVFLEDKLFETWNHGRTVLIGDAAHKLLPSAGQGAVCALQDAVILANCLYDLESLTRESIQVALQDYKDQRWGHVKEQHQKSQFNATVIYGQTFVERCIRYMVLNWVPESVKVKDFEKSAAYRPQINFLPPAPQRGTINVLPQKPSKRYQRELKEKKDEEERARKNGTTTVVQEIATTVTV